MRTGRGGAARGDHADGEDADLRAAPAEERPPVERGHGGQAAPREARAEIPGVRGEVGTKFHENQDECRTVDGFQKFHGKSNSGFIFRVTISFSSK